MKRPETHESHFEMKDSPVGVMDSGVGGLSVLREMRLLMPGEDFVYYGDNGNAPYGQRSVEDIIRLTCGVVDILLGYHIKALVIACNTATSAAARHLRETLSIPVIGMEPALKPAQALRHGGRILVLATPATLTLPKFQELMAVYGEGAVPVPITGLVEYIQRGELHSEGLYRLLEGILSPHLREGPVDAVVLGCTHYVFARDVIAKIVGDGVALVDGNRGTAAQVKRILEERELLSDKSSGNVTLLTSGNEKDYLPTMNMLIKL